MLSVAFWSMLVALAPHSEGEGPPVKVEVVEEAPEPGGCSETTVGCPETQTSSVATSSVSTSSVTRPNRFAEQPTPKPQKKKLDGQGFLSMGLQLEMGFFSSGDVNDAINASLPPHVTQEGFHESILLIGATAIVQIRPSRYFGLQPHFTYIFAPKIITIQGTYPKSEVYWAHAIAPGLHGRVYLPVSEEVELALSLGPALYQGWFEGRSGTSIGGSVTFGIQIDADGVVLGVSGYFRYAPIKVNDNFTINLTGGGIATDIALDLL